MRTFLGKAGIVLLLSGLLVSCREQLAEKEAEPSKRGPIVSKAMVVSAHPLASEVGVAILQKGGTAVDAAIAVQFALAVVHPSAGNIGGGGFMLVRAADGTVHSLDFREKAPAAAQRNMYLDSAGGVIGNLSWLGHQASGVPGVVEGMFAAHDSLGTLPMQDLIQPAIDLAEKGHLLTQKEAEGLNEQHEDLLKYNTRPTAYTDSAIWEAGDRIFHPQLALTLSRVRDLGRKGFYEGATADSIVAEMKRGKGLITHKDLKNYRSAWREPIRGSYRGYGIISMGPPSSGGIALMQLLKMVEPFPLGQYGRHSAEAV
ncbi:MAG: gamma-glutamyltransferase, partial [Bacteroidetes bacterium]